MCDPMNLPSKSVLSALVAQGDGVDSEQILSRLRAEGHDLACTYQAADLVVADACSTSSTAWITVLADLGKPAKAALEQAMAGVRIGEHRLGGNLPEVALSAIELSRIVLISEGKRKPLRLSASLPERAMSG